MSAKAEGTGCDSRTIPVTVKLTKGQNATAERWEGAPEIEAKSGNLLTHSDSSGVEVCCALVIRCKDERRFSL